MTEIRALLGYYVNISIHTPAWGVTANLPDKAKIRMLAAITKFDYKIKICVVSICHKV